MSVYRFKVFFEDHESIWRDIEIKSTQTFEDFHFIIQKAINFDDAHSASFYVSNDTWRKGKEIRILRSRKALQAGTWMHETKIAKFVDDPHQKFVYEFDPDGACWVLFVELSKILPDSPVDYPRIAKSNGTAPAQYKVTTPADLVGDEDDEDELPVEEPGKYVHKVTEHFSEAEEGAEEGPMALRTKTEEEMEGDVDMVAAEEEETPEDFEEESGFEEEEEV